MGELDDREGHPKTYKRIKVKVYDEHENEILAYTYKVVDKNKFQPPSKNYLNIIKKAARKYSFPEKYRNKLASIRTD